MNIDYSAGNLLNGMNGEGTFTLDGQEWAISYNGDFADNSTTGGNDVVLTTIPEFFSWTMIAGGFGMLIGWHGLRKRRRNS